MQLTINLLEVVYSQYTKGVPLGAIIETFLFPGCSGWFHQLRVAVPRLHDMAGMPFGRGVPPEGGEGEGLQIPLPGSHRCGGQLPGAHGLPVHLGHICAGT